MAAHFTCPACGYTGLNEPPRLGGGGSYEICASCGFEFGVTDDDKRYTYESWRERWVEHGMPWHFERFEPPPAAWNPVTQLSDLLERS